MGAKTAVMAVSWTGAMVELMGGLLTPVPMLDPMEA